MLPLTARTSALAFAFSQGLAISSVDWSKLRASPKVLAWHERMVERGLARASE